MTTSELVEGKLYYRIISTKNELRYSIEELKFERAIELNYGHWGTVYRFSLSKNSFTELNDTDKLFSSKIEASEKCTKLNLELIGETIEKLKKLADKLEKQ